MAWNKSDNVQWATVRPLHLGPGVRSPFEVDRRRGRVAAQRQVAGKAPVAPRHGRATAPGRTTVALTA